MKLDRPMCVLDLESTGLDVANDRIISVGVVKHYPENREPSTFDFLVNPMRPIPPEVTEITGVTQKMADAALPFSEVANNLIDYILVGSHLVGFNIHRFDLPLLVEEFLRCDIDFCPGGAVVDAGSIFKIKEARTLEAAVQFYLGQQMEGAHRAANDALATRNVFLAQLERYPDIQALDWEALEKFSAYDQTRVDFAGKLALDKDGDVIYTFGQRTKGVKVRDDVGFAYWILDKDFPLQTKKKLREVLHAIEQENMPPSVPFDPSIPF